MNRASLYPKPINDLLGEHFFIPSYQRGYRWTPKEVTDLLNDLLEFLDTKEKDDIYCLQPIVVKLEKERWTVIDGQQRLTTILLILEYFNKRLSEEYRKNLYSLEYETRIGSAKYISNIDPLLKDDNIDYYHIYNSHETIKKWFKDKQNLVNDLESILLNDTRVIWYEVDSSMNSINVFTRLNSGKIPLTNSELIKALFLSKAKSDKEQLFNVQTKQLQIAHEWDSIEYKLQGDSFWYFINNLNSTNRPMRIEYMFDLMAQEYGNSKQNKDSFHTFLVFNDRFKGDYNITTEWKRVKDYFLTFEEWYNDRVLYHLIGYLITIGEDIATIKAESLGKSKTAFKEHLKDIIFDKTLRNVNLYELEYGGGSKAIKKILLLFNVLTLVINKNSNLRFPFDLFKKESWDIEHIRSVKTEKPKGNKQQQKWLEIVLTYFKALAETNENKKIEKIITTIEKVLEGTKEIDDKFNSIYKSVHKYFKEDKDPENINSIANLTLLDSSTNRGYKNVAFPIKRRTILKNDMSGVFVPICTKNVFLKYYSDNPANLMYWEKSNATDYLDAIEHLFSQYFPQYQKQ